MTRPCSCPTCAPKREGPWRTLLAGLREEWRVLTFMVVVIAAAILV